MPLLALFRYGYRFSNLHLFEKHSLRLADYALRDILIVQLIGEVRSLLRRGLFQRYVKEKKELSSLRGRIDINALARRRGITRMVSKELGIAISVLPIIYVISYVAFKVMKAPVLSSVSSFSFSINFLMLYPIFICKSVSLCRYIREEFLAQKQVNQV